jgi:hypothetical protein
MIKNAINIFMRVSGNGGEILVFARSKAWVCGRSLSGAVGSNPAGDMDVCLL